MKLASVVHTVETIRLTVLALLTAAAIITELVKDIAIALDAAVDKGREMLERVEK